MNVTTKKRIRPLLCALALLAVGGSAVPVNAQTAPAYKAPTLEEMWKLPNLSGLTLSRTGRYLAANAPSRGKMNIVIIDMETRKGTIITGYENFDVVGMSWVGDDKLVYSLGQFNSPTGPGQFDGGGLYVVNRDGSGNRQLSATVRELRSRGQLVYRGYEFFRTIPGNDSEIIVSGNTISADSQDLFRMNLANGRTTVLTSGRPASRTVEWLMDSKLVPRVVIAGVKDELTRIVYYRSDEKSDWVELTRYSRDKGDVFVPLTFENDDKMMQVSTSIGRDTMAVFRYDPTTKKLGEMIASHPRFDMGASADGFDAPGVLVDGETNKILGYQVQGDKPETVWIDESRAALQKSLDAAIPGTINTWRRTPDGDRYIVTSFSDKQPTKWYILDNKKKTLEELGTSRPWLEGKLVEQRIMRLKTRDGLEIPGYYFLPPDYKPGQKYPTIVHIHGGPMARADTFGRGFGYIEGQIYASRGYVVIVPNFRITPGFGKKIYQAGFGSIGRQMSDDHEDALKWGIEQGFVDPKRACISGGSYGGYAALQAMVKSQDMWKCAVSGLSVTDLVYQNSSPETDYVSDPALVDYWKAVIGVKDLDSAITREMSPVNNAAKIKGAVFLYAGEDDSRVPIDQVNRMDRELRRAGNPPKAYVTKPKEGHGFGKLENNIDLYTQILKFLDEQIGK
jgi:dipeptidyl aminopeptidase/acylaminoacyl peptidase